MARTMDPHSAIVAVLHQRLRQRLPRLSGQDGWGYCVFGMVTDGMDVVNAIKDVKTGSRHGHQDVPVEDVVIEKAEVID